MRDHGVSHESSAVSLGGGFPLPGADVVAEAWSDRSPAGVFPQRPDKAKTMSAAMLGLGAALLLFVPLGGALLLVSGGVGLAISWETPMARLTTAPSISTDAIPTASRPQIASSTDH